MIQCQVCKAYKNRIYSIGVGKQGYSLDVCQGCLDLVKEVFK